MNEHPLFSRGLVPLCLLFTLAACDGETSSPDAGTLDGSVRLDADRAPCEADSDCGDTTMFCSELRCRPGDEGADARGCVDLGSPCPEGEACDEATDRCGTPDWCVAGREGCRSPGDCDGDGALALECGGTDCDDDDALRFPSNTELCDAEGVDEDCDATTFGVRDEDMDGAADASCCNEDTCGTDCDDARADVGPDSGETCNARDDDCDGLVDEETAGPIPLCPGGTCTGGRCSFNVWDRTFGSPLGDYGERTAVDAAGNVYVVGFFEGSMTVGGSTYSSTGFIDAFVMSYGPDGAVRWFTPIGSTGNDFGLDVTVGSGGTLYVAGAVGVSRFDFGFGERSSASSEINFVLALRSTDGTALWDRTFAGSASIAAAGSGGVYVATTPVGAADMGGGSVPESGAMGGDLHLAEYDASGSHLWDARHGGEGRLIVMDIDASSAGIVVGGGYYGTLGLGDGVPRTSMGRDDEYFVASFDNAAGTNDWVFSNSGAGSQRASAVVIDDAGVVYAIGNNDETVSFGGGRVHAASTAKELWTLRVENTGAYGWHSIQASTANALGLGVAIEPSGNPVFVGRFMGSIDLGGGAFWSTRMGSGWSGFVAIYDGATGVYRSDQVISSGGEAQSGVFLSDIAVGPGGTRAIVGAFRGSANFGLGLRSSTSFDVVTIRQAP